MTSLEVGFPDTLLDSLARQLACERSAAAVLRTTATVFAGSDDARGPATARTLDVLWRQATRRARWLARSVRRTGDPRRCDEAPTPVRHRAVRCDVAPGDLLPIVLAAELALLDGWCELLRLAERAGDARAARVFTRFLREQHDQALAAQRLGEAFRRPAAA